jgi:hypothetical protein
MIRFIPSSAAEPLSQALWSLSRPPAIRAEQDTQFLFGWVDALDGSRWLMVDTEYEINVHAEAELNGIADILQPWIDAGHLPADTNTQLAALVESNRGGRLVVYDAFPQLFKDMSKTREEMIAAGLLAEPVMPA